MLGKYPFSGELVTNVSLFALQELAVEETIQLVGRTRNHPEYKLLLLIQSLKHSLLSPSTIIEGPISPIDRPAVFVDALPNIVIVS